MQSENSLSMLVTLEVSQSPIAACLPAPQSAPPPPSDLGLQQSRPEGTARRQLSTADLSAALSAKGSGLAASAAALAAASASALALASASAAALAWQPRLQPWP